MVSYEENETLLFEIVVGVSVFMKNDLVSNGMIKRLYFDYADSVVLHINTRLYYQMILSYITYVSPKGSSIYRANDETNGISLLENNIARILSDFPNCYFYLAEVLKSGTSDLLDFIPSDSLDLVFNTKTDLFHGFFYMPRNSRDKGDPNSFGKTLIDVSCTYHMHIVNGRLFGDTVGQFTCLANDGHCIVDYHIV